MVKKLSSFTETINSTPYYQKSTIGS